MALTSYPRICLTCGSAELQKRVVCWACKRGESFREMTDQEKADYDADYGEDESADALGEFATLEMGLDPDVYDGDK